MKVVLLGNHSLAPFLGEPGVTAGMIRRTTPWNETLALALAELDGLDVHFISHAKLPHTRTFQRGRLSVTFLATPAWLNGLTLFHWTALSARRMVRDLAPELVHGIGTEHIWPTAALGAGLPCLTTVHGVMNRIIERTNPPLMSRARYFAALEKGVLRRSREVIAINPYIAEVLPTFGSRARVHHVENAVAEVFFAVGARPVESRTLLFVGHTGRGKGLLVLLRALEELRAGGKFSGWSLDVIGPQVADDHDAACRSLLSASPLGAQVRFLGAQSREQMLDRYRGAAAFLLPSEQETAPMSIAEAMACGLPVLATRVGGIPHMVTDGRSGWLVERDDVAGMSAALEQITSSPERRSEFGRAGRALAERWRPTVIARKTRDVYQRVLSLD